MGRLRFAHVPATGVTQLQGLHMCCHLLSFCSVYQYHCFTHGCFIRSSCDSEMLHITQYVTGSNSDIQWIISALKYQQNKFSASKNQKVEKTGKKILHSRLVKNILLTMKPEAHFNWSNILRQLSLFFSSFSKINLPIE